MHCFTVYSYYALNKILYNSVDVGSLSNHVIFSILFDFLLFLYFSCFVFHNNAIGWVFLGLVLLSQTNILYYPCERIWCCSCPCFRFGKNMRRAGFGSCFVQVILLLLNGIKVNFFVQISNSDILTWLQLIAYLCLYFQISTSNIIYLSKENSKTVLLIFNFSFNFAGIRLFHSSC